MKHCAFPAGVDRDLLIAWYREARGRTAALFEIPKNEVYYERPIALRNPIAFYEGHLPAFAINTLIRLGLRQRGISESYETLFARGIDPEDEASAKSPTDLWPARRDVQDYGRCADERIIAALAGERIEDDSIPALRGGEAVFTVLEHELMHQETLLYMLHNLPLEAKIARAPLQQAGERSRTATKNELIAIPRGLATLGNDRSTGEFGWDNEFPSFRIDVPAFSIERHNVTNAAFLEFVESGAYRDRQLWSAEGWKWIEDARVEHPHFWTRSGGAWRWRGMFDEIPLPLDWPVYVTHAEADAYARWRGQRLPSEAEWHRAAYGTPGGGERAYPWGDEPPDATRGHFDFASGDPVPVGARPGGASAWGVHDLLGNGWEWTWTPFDGFPGFTPMASYPEYSADFFDAKHRVIKGGSPATARELLRRSFRNWFRPTYPWVWAAFRCVTPIA